MFFVGWCGVLLWGRKEREVASCKSNKTKEEALKSFVGCSSLKGPGRVSLVVSGGSKEKKVCRPEEKDGKPGVSQALRRQNRCPSLSDYVTIRFTSPSHAVQCPLSLSQSSSSRFFVFYFLALFYRGSRMFWTVSFSRPHVQGSISDSALVLNKPKSWQLPSLIAAFRARSSMASLADICRSPSSTMLQLCAH